MQKAARWAAFWQVRLERAMRFELTTLTLARLCSTPELRPRRLDAAHLLKACAGFKGKVQPIAEF